MAVTIIAFFFAEPLNYLEFNALALSLLLSFIHLFTDTKRFGHNDVIIIINVEGQR